MLTVPEILTPMQALVNESSVPTNPGVANQKSAWVAIGDGAIDHDYESVYIGIRAQTAGGQMLVDFGIGAAGFEQVAIPNVHVGVARPIETGYTSMWFPLRIPAGTRTAVRAATNSTTMTARIMFAGYKNSMPGLQGLGSLVDTYGADLSDSGGTVVDPGAVASTWGAWHQIHGAIPNDIIALGICVGNQFNAAMGDVGWFMRVGIGEMGKEFIILDYLRFTSSIVTDEVSPMMFGAYPISLPAGTRLVCQLFCSSTDAADRLVDITMYGVRA